MIGFVLYTVMARLHPRYTEGFTPAVAAAAGIGAAWALRDGLWQRIAAIAGALALVLYGRDLLDGASTTLADQRRGGLVAAVAAALPNGRVRTGLLAAGLAVAGLGLPATIDRSLIRNHEYDNGRTGAMAPSEVREIGAYIGAHRRHARYEFAAADPSEVGALIVAERQPILSLTSYDAHELLPIPGSPRWSPRARSASQSSTDAVRRVPRDAPPPARQARHGSARMARTCRCCGLGSTVHVLYALSCGSLIS